MSKISRRDFLKKSSSLTVTAAAMGMSETAFSEEPHIQFPTEPRARLAVASYPFRDFITNPRRRQSEPKQPMMEIKDFGAMVVKKFNLKNIEPWSGHFASTDTAYVSGLREAFDQAGAHVINIPGDIHDSVYDPDAAHRMAAVKEGKAWVDAAATLGSPSVRIHVGRVRGAEPNVERAAESLGQIADYGAGKNVVINLENDDLVSEDAFFIVKVIEKANHPYLHALPDFANSMTGGDADFNYRAISAMFKNAYCISHVKEGEDAEGGKFFPVDVGKTFAIAKAAGYRGFFSMEMDRKGDPFEGTQMLIDLSLKYLG
ncbi:MAG TPA: TIM barrel protein [Terriglobia bacterium]|nr:TIM barrel protein [Terriglobia bacterium]